MDAPNLQKASMCCNLVFICVQFWVHIRIYSNLFFFVFIVKNWSSPGKL